MSSPPKQRRRAVQRATSELNIISTRLPRARKQHGLTQETLALAIEDRFKTVFDKTSIAKIESGTRGVSDFEVMMFSVLLEVPSDWLLGIVRDPINLDPAMSESAPPGGSPVREAELENEAQLRIDPTSDTGAVSRKSRRSSKK